MAADPFTDHDGAVDRGSGTEGEDDARLQSIGLTPEKPRRFARSYSRFVQWAKLLLPVVALVVIVLVAIWPHIQPEDSRFSIGFAALTDPESDEPSMVNARYVGNDNKSRPFSVTADLARTQGRGPGIVELEVPKADMTLEDGTWLVLTAESGVFDRNTKHLELIGSVNLFHDMGYEFRTEKAMVDLSESQAWSEVPVEGQGPFGSLQAEGFRLLNKDKTIYFSGRSKLVIEAGVGEKR